MTTANRFLDRLPGRRDDAGITIAEALIGMFLAVLVGVIGVGLAISASSVDRSVTQGSQVWRELTDANAAILRDARDGHSLRVGEDERLALTVVRDGTCRVRTYAVVDGGLTLTESFYETELCVGPFEDRVEVLIPVVSSVLFTYQNEKMVDVGTPINAPKYVRGIEWRLEAPVGDTGKTKELDAAVAFKHRPEHTGTGVEQERGLSPYLQVTTPREGVDAPVLTWSDSSPSLTTQWTVYRTWGPEHLAKWGPGEAVANLPSDASTWTDSFLEAGHGAEYHVVAWLTSGQTGPPSNTVVTGLRPPAPTGVTATGSGQAITVGWIAPVGATAYDVYRDGALLASVGNVLTYTDNAGYGHAHTYQVVALNQWEARSTTGSPQTRVATGTALTKTFPGGHTRLASAAAGAFTAPAAPTVTATPTTSASTTVARDFAGWTGAGPVGARNRGWQVQHHPAGGSWAQLGSEHAAASYTHAGRTGGATDHYRARACNASGCGPWSGPASALQRPAQPSCSIDQITTRSMRVTINRPAMASAYTRYDIKANRSPAAGTGEGTTYQRVIDQLPHNATTTFTVRTRNGSPAGDGWSNTATCAASTSALTATLGTITTTTRGITVRGANASNGLRTNGSVARLWIGRSGVELAGWTTAAVDRTWDQAVHNRDHRVYLDVTDGHNNLSVNRLVTTARLSISIGATSSTTRGITIVGRTNGGLDWTGAGDRLLEIVRGSTVHKSWTGLASDRTYDTLTHGLAYTVRATHDDGINRVTATKSVSTKTLTAGAANCTAALQTGTAPGSIRIAGGHQVRMGSSGTIYAGPRTYSSLSAGSYTGRARNQNSDGYNSVSSAWNICPTRTVKAPTPPPTWSPTPPTLACGARPSESDLRYLWQQTFGVTYFTPSTWAWEYKVTAVDGNGRATAANWRISAVRRSSGMPETTSGVYTCKLGI